MSIFPPSLAFWSKDLTDLLLSLRKPSVFVLILSSIILPAASQWSLGPPGFWVWHFMMSIRAKPVKVALIAKGFPPPTLIFIVSKFLLLTIRLVRVELHSFAIHPLVGQTVQQNAKMLPSRLFPDANLEIFISTSAHLLNRYSRRWWQVEKQPAS